jgi:hypothetical protein
MTVPSRQNGMQIDGRPRWCLLTRRRAVAIVPTVLAISAVCTGANVALNDAQALAAACGTPVAAGSSCTLTGTLNVTAGTLTLTSPSSLTWSATLNGTNQSVVDTTAVDQQYTVDDATGSGAGWHVTLSATTFTNGTHTLANTGTFVNTGSVTSISATTGPTATCATGATCTLPTNSTTYPVAVTTAASSPAAVTIYDTAAGTGLGQIVVGGSTAANPVGWWLNVPANAYSGAYTSTVTLAVVSAP